VSQQQSGSQSLLFTSQFGTVRLEDLHKIGAERPREVPQETHRNVEVSPAQTTVSASEATPRAESRATPEPASHDDIFAKIERLADLRSKGILTDEEFATKKTELLARL